MDQYTNGLISAKNGQRARNNEKVGTWNICDLTDKEPEVAEFVIERGISVPAITDTRRKRTVTKEIDSLFLCGPE